MSNFSEFKTPIFADINDQPQGATETEASNGSDLINKVNGLCDRLSSTVSSPLGDTTIYYDTANVIDPSSLADNEITATSLEEIISLLESGLIYGEITIVLSSALPQDTVFNLENIKCVSGSQITLEGQNTSVQSGGDAVFGDGLFINIPEKISIAIVDLTITIVNQLDLQGFQGLELINCKINASSGYSEFLLSVGNIKNVRVSDSAFAGITGSNSSEQLIEYYAIEKLLLEQNNYGNTLQDTIILQDCSVIISGAQRYNNNPNHDRQRFIVANNSSISLVNGSNIKPIHVISNNSNIEGRLATSPPTKQLTFQFESMNNENKTLIANPQSSFSIAKLHVHGSNSAASYYLQINGNTVIATEETASTKVFDLTYVFNRMTKGTTERLTLGISGVSYNIVAFLEITTY